jgi:hypothetical protein
MPQQSGDLGLPSYRATDRQKKWVADKTRTAQLIQMLWRAASSAQRKEPAFLSLLTQCGWTNVGKKGKGRESTREVIWNEQNPGTATPATFLAKNSNPILSSTLVDSRVGYKRSY